MGCCPPATNEPLENSMDKSQPLDSFDNRIHAGKEEGDRLKKIGNGLFKQGKYQEALVQYDKAIVTWLRAQNKYPLEPIYFVNRAMCMRRLQRWKEALSSIEKALLLDSSHVKARINKAICLAELSKVETGVAERKHYLIEAQQLLDGVRHYSELSSQVEPILQKVEVLVDHCKLEAERTDDNKFLEYLLQSVGRTKLSDQLRTYYNNPEELRTYLKELVRTDEQHRECPDYMQDPISYEIFKQPFLSPSGISYERELLMDHIRSNGATDPTTKEDLSKREPFANKALNSLVDSHEHSTRWRKIERARISPQFINF